MKKYFFLLSQLLILTAFAVETAKPVKKAVTDAPAKKNEIDDDTKIVLKAVEDRYQKLKSWEAEFSQETYSTGLGTTTANGGKVSFVAPNKFRFSLTLSENSDFISNGKNAWYVQFPKGRGQPAFVRHFKDLKKIELDRYLVFLRGFNNSQKDFALKGKTEGDIMELELSPKKSSEISRITLTFRRGIIYPEIVKIEDLIGNTTTLRLKNFKNLPNPENSAIQKLFRPEYLKDSKVETF